ncbi:UDP-glucosyltransferase 2-like [Schistocerca serialis cubense]|uniref:UDP-glucosyltransferase 2-like n=1 Tax=Schistocerca serialis cubense TaxID=2023355 RepID=UPI00214E229E|nr:UDP-glucosyltransferase 2-like [Schistocerca serialis cubense]
MRSFYGRSLATMNDGLFRVVLLLLVLTNITSASKILVVAPTASISHQKAFHVVTKALLERGHEVTLFTTDPLKVNHQNLTEVDLSSSYKMIRDLDIVGMADMTPLDVLLSLLAMPSPVESQLREPAVQDFIRRNHTFDLMILERLPYQGYYGLHHKIGSPPLVGFVTLSAYSPVYYAMGNAMNPAYIPEIWEGFSDHMNFWQRLYNTYFTLRFHYMWFYKILPQQEMIMREHFGAEPPSVHETERNYSLLIVNNHFTTEYPRPHLPSVIEVTGLHVSTKVERLPDNIQKFIDGAEHGVIYVSLGSNVRSNALPQEKFQAFLEAFRQLPQRVLWKWENDTLPSQPENVMVSKWMPQQSVLAHPNVRLFIMQGGLQSMNEATYHAVPLVVIPFFADQPHNAAKISQAEIGVRLDYHDVTKDNLLATVRTVLGEPKYAENMKRLSAVYREHKADSLERAVWWIEYVIRHKGDPHLRSAVLDLHWWQLLLLDVVAFVLAVVALTLCLVYFVTRRAVSFFTGSKQKQKQKKQ